MKRVGILTFHRAINYGAVLQAYALNKFINDNNIECDTIDYRCDYIEKEYKLLNIDYKDAKKSINSVINLSNNIKRKKMFKKFIQDKMKISKISYDKKNIHNSNNYYDIFITGSDQVWNIDLCKDANYYLSFAQNRKKISYAASFGNKDIISRNPNIVKENLKQFDLLTVREQSAVDELKKEYEINSVNVVDPTFLLTKKEWESILPHDKQTKKYIIIYVLHENSAYDIANKMSTELGIPIYIISQSIKKRIKGKYIRSAGPIEFLDLIRNSEYVVTDSFHGTALSIIFQKNLKVVLKKKNQYLNDRLQSILDNFNLNDCIVDSNSDLKKMINKTDYGHSEEIVKKKIEESKKILLNSLNF